MTIVVPVPITAGPAVPDSSAVDTTFDAMFQAFLTWQKNVLQPGSNAMADATYQNAQDANTKANAASGSADTASLKAADATAAAAAAVNAPGTSATSTTSLAVSAGTKTLTIQTGKLFAKGQNLVIAYTTDPLKQMVGAVTAHDNTTGLITIEVPAGSFSGAGTYAAWTVSITASAVSTPTITAAAALAAGQANLAAFVFSRILK